MFCGHRELHDETVVRSWLCSVISGGLISEDTRFLFGGYGRFDILAASVVKQMKETTPGIEIVLVLPYLNKEIDSELYDSTVYPPIESVPPRYAIVHRNRWMVDNSDLVIAYVTHGWGGAASTLKYAERKKKRVILYLNI